MEGKSKKTSVIDSSFMLCYLLPDEQHEEVQKVFDTYKTGELDLVSLPLFPFEVINGIYAAVLSKRLERTVAEELITEFLKLPIMYEQVNLLEVFKVAQENRISVYDASYLFLARQKQIPLLTLGHSHK